MRRRAGLPVTADVLVVGTGLIGTSVVLALRASADVLLADASPRALDEAVRRGAGRAWDGQETVRTAVLCTPVPAVAEELERLQSVGAARSYTHVASVQAAVQRDVETRGCRTDTLCGGHPMAGRERSGPAAAAADLFSGRPWVLCPSLTTLPTALRDVEELVVAVGADPVRLAPADHDAAVALVSHLPQVTASALAAQLLDRDRDAVALSGPGLQDTTRIAGSDPDLWREVLRLNAANVAPLVRALAQDLLGVAEALAELAAAPDPAAEEVVVDTLRRGRQGRGLVPVKRGERDTAFGGVAVQVPDRPGQLAGLLVAAAQAGVNVEDVRVDHVPGTPRGVIELSVRAEARARAEQALRAAGWDVLSGSPSSG